MSAEDIIQDFISEGTGCIHFYDGSFLIILYDVERKQIYIFNDVSASIPLQYTFDDSFFCFSPEAKVIFDLVQSEPCVNKKGLLSFLQLGYLPGNLTLFSSIFLLQPAHILIVDVERKTFESKPYWEFTFHPDSSMTLKEAVEETHRRLLTIFHAICTEYPIQKNILLTGGYDSRLLLGYLNETSHIAEETITWGEDETRPLSDPLIAKKISEALGIPHRFYRYTADMILDHAVEWVYVSELLSDNFGHFAGGPFFFYHDTTYDHVWIADQVFGPGGIPTSYEDAFVRVLNLPGIDIIPPLTQVLKKDIRHEVKELFNNIMSDWLPMVSSLKDLNDELYFYFYVFRWLYAPGYYKEPMITAVRPFMFREILDFILFLPEIYRVDKLIVRNLLKYHFPFLAHFPVARTTGLIQWSQALSDNHRFRRFLIENIQWERIRKIPFMESWLDRDEYEKYIQSFIHNRVQIKSQEVGGFIQSIRRAIYRIPIAGKFMKHVESKIIKKIRKQSYHFDFIRRMFLLVLFMESLERFSDRHRK